MTYEEKKQKWWNFHKATPSVYEYFQRFTHEAISRGAKHCSPWLIFGRIRWETHLSTTDKDFKVSNDYIAFYSRLFMKWNPKHQGFFKTKPMKGERYASIK